MNQAASHHRKHPLLRIKPVALAVATTLLLQATAAAPEADTASKTAGKPSLFTPQGDGKGLKFQSRFDNGADLTLSGQYSSLFGFVASGELSSLLGDDGAAYLRLQAGPNLREALLRSGVRFAEDRGMAIITVRELRNRLNYQFQGGSEAETWMREALYGAELSWKVSDVSLGAYAAYRKAPSKSLGYHEYSENLANLYRRYQIEQRIAGGTVGSAGLKADWLLSPEWTFWLNAGLERRSIDYMAGENSRTGATGGMGLDWRSDTGLSLKLQAGAAIHSINGSLLLDYPLSEGWSSYIRVSGEHDSQINRNNTTGEIGLRYNFGGKGAATSASQRSGNQAETTQTAEAGSSEKPAAALRHNQALAAAGYSQSELRRLVTQVPQYANSLLVNASVDNTVTPELLVEIDKRGLDRSTALNTENGNLTITAPNGAELGELQQFTQTFAGKTSALPLNLVQLSADRKSATLTVQALKNHMAAGSTATNPAELNVVFRNFILTLQAYQGSVRIISSKLQVNTANQDQTPPEFVQKPAISSVKDRLATLGLTLNEAGTISYLLQAATVPAPAASLFGSAAQQLNVSANTPASISLTGLTPATSYVLYLQARDLAGNLQPAYTSVAFTTLEEQLPPVMGDVPDQTLSAGSAFSLSLAAYARITNGDPITSYTLASGSLPAGLTLNPGSGQISGTPTATGTFSVTVAANDKDGVSNSDRITFTVNPPADTTPDSFTFADQSNVALSALTESAPITVAGINTASPISVAGGEYSINGGAWTSAAGTVTNGQTVKVRHTSSASNATATNTVLTIGGVSDTFTSTTLAVAADTTPDAFSFVDQTGVALSTLTESAAITVAGINSASPISVAGGEYSINGGTWTSAAGTVTNGQTVKVRHTSSASNSTATNTVLTIGGVADTFTTTTLAAAPDTTPDAFSFTDVTGSTVSTVSVSNAITVTGINTPAAISVSDGEYSVNSGAWTSAAGNVNASDTVRVRLTSGSNPGDVANAVLTIGGVSDTYTVTNAVNVAPTINALTIAHQAAGTTSGTYTITAGDANGGMVDVYIVDGFLGMTINGVTAGSSTVTTDIGHGSRNYRKWTVPAGSSVSYTISIAPGSVGPSVHGIYVRDPQGLQAEWTQGFFIFSSADTTPDSFSFVDQTGVALSTLTESAAITVAGINTASPISVAGGEYSLNGGAWTSAAGTVTNGQTVKVRHTSSASNATATNTVLTIGGVSDTFTSTTLAVAADTTPDAFSFTDVSGATVSTQYTSNSITVAGINAAAAITLSVGEYRINGGAWTSAAGTVNNGDTVQLRVTSDSTPGNGVNAVLTIGGVSDTYTVSNAASVAPTIGAPTIADQVAGTTSGTYTITTGDANGGNVDVYVNVESSDYTINALTAGSSLASRDIGFGSMNYRKWTVPAGSAVQFTLTTALGTGGSGGVAYMFHVVDPQGLQANVESTFNILAANHAPTASNFSYGTAIGNADKTFDWKTLSAAADADNDSLTASVTANGSKGSFAVSGNNLTYTPNQYQSGNDSATLRISDNKGGTKDITVTVTGINTLNVAPTISGLSDFVMPFMATVNKNLTCNDANGGNVDVYVEGEYVTIAPVTAGALANQLVSTYSSTPYGQVSGSGTAFKWNVAAGTMIQFQVTADFGQGPTGIFIKCVDAQGAENSSSSGSDTNFVSVTVQ